MCAEEAARCDCSALHQALQLVGGNAQRMVVGHTIQAGGISEACDQRVFRIDVGLSHGCGDGAPQVRLTSMHATHSHTQLGCSCVSGPEIWCSKQDGQGTLPGQMSRGNVR